MSEYPWVGMRLFTRYRSAIFAGLGGFTVFGTYFLSTRTSLADREFAGSPHPQYLRIPTRQEQLKRLQSGEDFDVLVIGGGATGCGVALDATTRGLRVALVERNDFSSGTSSRSTKLIHGGVRYLQKAIFNADIEQFRMVMEALHERATLLKLAPHLSYPLPIAIPCVEWWNIPYYWAGSKLYDLVAGSKLVAPSYFLGRVKALEQFPMLRKESLKGAMVYYDSGHNDSRMNLSLALTSADYGATIANHVSVTRLHKVTNRNGEEQVCGAYVKDALTGQEWLIKATAVVNATGPFTDSIQNMDEPGKPPMVAPSSGVHVVLPDYYSPEGIGLLDPATKDGRVIFFLPWQGHTIAGTTDAPCDIQSRPVPTDAEIDFILDEIKSYLNPDMDVRRDDVLSAWTGIRPLVRDPNAKDTQSLVRNHICTVSPSGLVTISGGKWTTYRVMAEDTVNQVLKSYPSLDRGHLTNCRTEDLPLHGAVGYTPMEFIQLIQTFGMEMKVAKHLASTYGSYAYEVAALAQVSNSTTSTWNTGKVLVAGFPYLEAEVNYAIREYAATAVDVLAYRTRLAFLNTDAALQALPRIISIMAKAFDWNEARQKQEYDDGVAFLRTCGMGMESLGGSVRKRKYHLSSAQRTNLREYFSSKAAPLKGQDVINTVDLVFIASQMGVESTSPEMVKVVLRRVWEAMPPKKDLKDRVTYEQCEAAVEELMNVHLRQARLESAAELKVSSNGSADGK